MKESELSFEHRATKWGSKMNSANNHWQLALCKAGRQKYKADISGITSLNKNSQPH